LIDVAALRSRHERRTDIHKAFTTLGHAIFY